MLQRVFNCVLLIAGLGISGEGLSQKDPLLNLGITLPYADGFDDGCYSGKKAGGSLFGQFHKDRGRFVRDTLYSQGWSDGFRQCETQLESIQRETRMAMEQQRLLQQKQHYAGQEQRHLEREVMFGVDSESLQSLK
jgi:hypothetical protein